VEKQNPKLAMSFGLLVPIVWFAIEASQSVSRWLAIMGYEVPIVTDYLEGSPLDRAIYTALMALGVLILLSRKIKWGEVVGNNRWLCALFFYMLLSTLWSDVPDVSVKRWVRTLADGVMVLVVVTESDPLNAACTVLRRVLYIHFPLSIIFIKYIRSLGTAWDYAGVEMWTGITLHKNVLGEVVLMGGIYFLFEIIRNWGSKKVWIYSTYLLMALWLLFASPVNRSNTSIALFVLGALLLFILHFVKSGIEKIHRYVMLCICIIGVTFLALELGQAVTGESMLSAGVQASGRDLTLSGRTDLWNDLLEIAADQPILGVGYGSFWIGNTHHLWEKHFWGPTQGHNGYIDVYLELGLIGLLLLGGVVISAYRDILKAFPISFEQGALRFVWLIIILLHNITESSFLRGTVDMWFMFLLATVNWPPRTLSDNDRSTAANDPQPSASCSARNNPQRIPANTPPFFPGLPPRI
jgi:exopolysaccharide production protein ExoQ